MHKIKQNKSVIPIICIETDIEGNFRLHRTKRE